MRIANEVHESGPWRIHDIVADFTLEDVWALPVYGGAEDFEDLLRLLPSLDPANGESRATRVLWRVRDGLGRWLDLGRIPTPSDEGEATKLPIPGTTETSLTERLPDDLRNTATGLDFRSLPFDPLYRTDTEFAAGRRTWPSSSRSAN